MTRLDPPGGDLADHYARQSRWAVVGASENPRKFGHRIYVRLRESGYEVVPINPHEPRIAGDPAYPSLRDLPRAPAVVDMVIPPAVALEVVRDAIAIGARAIWFQPGSENSEAASLAREHGLDVIEDCILVRMQDLRSL